jgi:hypothetical protein
MDAAAPPAPPPVLISEQDRKILELLKQLRIAKKPVILLLDETGAIRIYRGERAGIVPPP